MIGDNNSTIKEDEINDLSISNNKITNNELFKSANRRKQIKPNRVTSDDDGIQRQELIIDESTNLINGHQSSPEEYISNNNNNNNNDNNNLRQQQEVYCNLCERSFCNKYFLKTHFVKKHGGFNMVSPLSLTENNDNGNVSLSPSSPCLSNEQPLPLISSQQTSPINNNNNNNNNDNNNTKTVEKKSEDYCEICQKHFCNKYYLRKHKGECHGVYTDYIKSLQKSTNETPVKTTSNRPSPSIQTPSNHSNTLLLNPFYPGPSDIKSLFPIPSSPNINIKSTSSSSSSSPKLSRQRPIRRCNICEQEFRNKSLYRMHMKTFHPNEKNEKIVSSSSPIISSNNLGFLSPFVDTSSQLAQKIVTGQSSQPPYGIVNDSYFCAKMADRVVCEICNKQVCNKYFLKTHKAKVHGIKSTETQEQINENIDNSNTYCSLCKKDFSTTYLYLFHMQTIHNDTSDPTYQTLIEFMQRAAAINENSNPFLPLVNTEQLEDETDSNDDKLKRKRSLSQASTDNQNKPTKRFNSLTETNAGLQPFLLESEDPKFSHTFVPCMVYLPVTRRVTKQVKINLKLNPVLADASP
ncbi:unnamed protein product [Rotaria sordida]|uniref:C2H2-type domain-containing protein n=1 Tax=Rotaria sordida TaxID=392033 RepID=A0A814SEA4_9BILA|nr:unnamed protein product [Rotaria sordida]CAF1145271.1 unnamed protein product [Rotaria sordida]